KKGSRCFPGAGHCHAGMSRRERSPFDKVRATRMTSAAQVHPSFTEATEGTRMLSEKDRRTRWLLLNICLLGGALLTFIGIRYFVVPHAAARTFGVPGRPTGFELHYVLGLRNVWLGLLAVALAVMREWRALALWFAGAVFVCFSDAFIAARSIGGL